MSSIEISYSQVRAYLNCPWLYKIIYIDFKRPPLKPNSALGLSIHKTLEAFHRENGASLERLLELYDEHWVRAGFPSPEERMAWRRKGEQILRAYWDEEFNRRSVIVGVEREFLFPLGPHQVRGTIDRMDRRPDGELEIIDYKTHLDIESEQDVAKNIQLRIYGLGAKEGLGLDPSWLTLYYVAAGRRVSVRYDPMREEEIRQLLWRVADLIEHSRAFLPNTSYCRFCDFRRLCPHSVSS